MDYYAKKNLSTKQSQKSEKARIQIENEDSGRAKCDQTSSPEGSQEINTIPLLSSGLPKENRLRKRSEFQAVYKKGKRIQGRFMTAFIMPSETSFQRIGITASKKAIGNAVKRNRSRRLLREAFRLSKEELGKLDRNYDWVLNARKQLLEVKLEKPLEEFRGIVAKVKKAEAEINKGEENVVR